MHGRVRGAVSVAAAGLFVVLFTATSYPEPPWWLQADQDARWILVPLDAEGLHEGHLEIVIYPPGPAIVAEGEQEPAFPWSTMYELDIVLENPDARPSLDLVDGWTGERQRIVDGVALWHGLRDCDEQVGCVVRIPLAFDGRRGRADAVEIRTKLGAWVEEYEEVELVRRPSMSVDWVPEPAPDDLAEGPAGDEG